MNNEFLNCVLHCHTEKVQQCTKKDHLFTICLSIRARAYVLAGFVATGGVAAPKRV